jgi:pimeloyl-ACP methyl ester carboxylesterase
MMVATRRTSRQLDHPCSLLAPMRRGGEGADTVQDHGVPTAQSEVKGRGAPLVLVPGGLTGMDSWRSHADRLSHDHLVILTQLLAVEYGLRNEPLPAGYGLKTESDALMRALDDLQVDRAHLVGWSNGGAIALDVALDHPDRVRTLTLVEPATFWVLRGFDRFGPDAQAAQRSMDAYARDEITEAHLEAFLYEAAIVPGDADARREPRWPVWVEHRRSLRAVAAPGHHEDDVARLARFDRPTLLFKGIGSNAYDREIVDLIGRACPHARVQELPGAHVLPLVSMGPFLAILTAFVAEHHSTD